LAAVAGSGNVQEEASVTTHDVIGSRHDGGEGDTTQLSPSELMELRAQLLRELEQQTEVLAEQSEQLDEIPAGAAGALEVERDVAEELLTRRHDAIEEITGALARIDAHTYGRCQECQGAIPVERLEIIPYARLCVPCQAVRSGTGRR
jgi:DnaK suppressor protein